MLLATNPRRSRGLGQDSSDWSSISSFFQNAVTGNLSDSQVQSLTDQETQSLIQAGMDPASAAAQAAADQNAALSTFTGTGGLNLSWTGALPSQPGFGSAAGSWLTTYGPYLLVGATALVAVVAIGALRR
jgi:hypothetical protein